MTTRHSRCSQCCPLTIHFGAAVFKMNEIGHWTGDVQLHINIIWRSVFFFLLRSDFWHCPECMRVIVVRIGAAFVYGFARSNVIPNSEGNEEAHVKYAAQHEKQLNKKSKFNKVIPSFSLLNLDTKAVRVFGSQLLREMKTRCLYTYVSAQAQIWLPLYSAVIIVPVLKAILITTQLFFIHAVIKSPRDGRRAYKLARSCAQPSSPEMKKPDDDDATCFAECGSMCVSLVRKIGRWEIKVGKIVLMVEIIAFHGFNYTHA